MLRKNGGFGALVAYVSGVERERKSSVLSWQEEEEEEEKTTKDTDESFIFRSEIGIYTGASGVAS